MFPIRLHAYVIISFRFNFLVEVLKPFKLNSGNNVSTICQQCVNNVSSNWPEQINKLATLVTEPDSIWLPLDLEPHESVTVTGDRVDYLINVHTTQVSNEPAVRRTQCENPKKAAILILIWVL